MEQFFVALGHCLESARLGELNVVVELEDGEVLQGVPHSSPTDPDGQEIDDTGVSPYAEIDGSVVMLQHVRSYRVIRPE